MAPAATAGAITSTRHHVRTHGTSGFGSWYNKLIQICLNIQAIFEIEKFPVILNQFNDLYGTQLGITRPHIFKSLPGES